MQTKYEIGDTVLIRAKIKEIQISKKEAEYIIVSNNWSHSMRYVEKEIIWGGNLKDIPPTETLTLPCETGKYVYILDEQWKIHRLKVMNEMQIHFGQPYIKCKGKKTEVRICSEDIGNRVFLSLPAAVITVIKKEIERWRD